LTRFFGFHVAVLPAITILLLVIHLALIQRQGISVPPGMEPAMHVLAYLRKHDPAAAELLIKEAGVQPETREMPFFPNFLLRDLLLWLIVLNLLAILAVFFPWELGKKADPFAPAPAGIKPEWYFMFMFQTLKYIPAQLWIVDGEVLGIMAFSIAGLLWTLVPVWDRQSSRGERNRFINYLGLFAVMYIIVLTILGWKS